jgi:ABC-type bacteriocin/lantibiotic exporter with double-glycine peptidase domain
MTIVAAARQPDGVPGGADLADWRVPNRCAHNCLYALSRLSGTDVKYAQIYESLAAPADGANLRDMRRCAAALGLKTRVVKATPETLQVCPLPAIAHTEEEKGVTGHYVVLISVGRDEVEVIDGTLGTALLIPKAKFFKEWTGYLLILDRPTPWGSWMISALAGTVGGLLTFSRLRRRRSVARNLSTGG